MANIFISYAREDEELARYITKCLRNRGHEPWLDREKLLAGDHLDEELIRAAKSADCGVFLVGWDFIRSYYTKKEIQLFAMRDKQGKSVRRIGILRAPRDGGEFEERIPAELAPLITEEWIDGVTDPELAIGNLCCAVEQERLPDAERKAIGKALAEGMTAPEPLLPVTDPRSRDGMKVSGSGRASLFCDRETPWNSIETTYAQPLHHLLLIVGSRSEGHDYFVTRIDHHLRKEPPHERVHVQWWPLRPLGRDAYREAIAEALQCGVKDLAGELKKRMSHLNLILIHPVVDDDYDDEHFVDYYKRWLPELIAEAQPAMRLKSVQPVAWSEATGMRRMLNLHSEDEQEARSLLAAIEEETPALTTVKIELEPITEKQVETFCGLNRFSERERQRLDEMISRRKRCGSRDILAAIDTIMQSRG